MSLLSVNCFPRESFVIGAAQLLRNTKSISGFPIFSAVYAVYSAKLLKRRKKKEERAFGDNYRK